MPMRSPSIALSRADGMCIKYGIIMKNIMKTKTFVEPRWVAAIFFWVGFLHWWGLHVSAPNIGTGFLSQ